MPMPFRELSLLAADSLGYGPTSQLGLQMGVGPSSIASARASRGLDEEEGGMDPTAAILAQLMNSQVRSSTPFTQSLGMIQQRPISRLDAAMKQAGGYFNALPAAGYDAPQVLPQVPRANPSDLAQQGALANALNAAVGMEYAGGRRDANALAREQLGFEREQFRQASEAAAQSAPLQRAIQMMEMFPLLPEAARERMLQQVMKMMGIDEATEPNGTSGAFPRLNERIGSPAVQGRLQRRLPPQFSALSGLGS